MTSSWFFLSTLNYDARSTIHQTGLVFSAYASCRRRCVSGYGVRVLWCVSGVVATGEALVNVFCKSAGVSSEQSHITLDHTARKAEVTPQKPDKVQRTWSPSG